MMEKRFDVVALGELLIDFTENGLSSQGNLKQLGKKTAFIGKVGRDQFGMQLKQVVEESGTDVSNLIMDEKVHTTLAFVHTMPDGDREFSFYRNPGADMMLRAEELQEQIRALGELKMMAEGWTYFSFWHLILDPSGCP